MELALHGSQVDFKGFFSRFANQCDHYFECCEQFSLDCTWITFHLIKHLFFNSFVLIRSCC